VARLLRRLWHLAILPVRPVEAEQPFGKAKQGLDAQPYQKPENKIDRHPNFEDDVPFRLLWNNIASDASEGPAESSAIHWQIFFGELIQPGVPDPERSFISSWIGS
jgi:hypothetical protein